MKNYYDNTERNGSHFASKIAFSLEGLTLNPEMVAKKIQEARLEYGLDAVEFYANPLATRLISANPERADLIPPASLETLQRLFSGKNECKVQNVGVGELVRCGTYLGMGKGIVFANYFIPIALASQLSEISLTFQDYKSDNPLNYPIKSTYFAILSMVTLLILFTAMDWLCMWYAHSMGPIEELLRGTEEVAHGNLEYEIPTSRRKR